MNAGISAAGNWIIDRVKIVDVYPEQDALANILRESSSNGGSAYNILKALAKIGYVGGLAGIGLIGDDEGGEQILQDCKSLGIDTSLIKKSPRAPTSYTDVMMVEGTGRRTFFHQRGANAEFHWNGEGAVHHVHLGYLLLLDAMDAPDPEIGTQAARTLSSIKANGGTTSLDVVSEDSDRFSKIVLPALKFADVAFMNEFELARTVGMPISNEAELVSAGCQLSFECRQWLVVHTPNVGFVFQGGKQIARQGAVDLPVELIKGTVGAGDAFAAGYLSGFTDGFEPQECLRFAVCVAASSLLAADASSGILPWAECLRLADIHGFRC
ncbi:MAG TPA: carbohydrate kinase family protein [Fimbriimonadaceae bacterium]|nr:carbohydrate kinase family protein [Fimbriimonadaceae bacterium]